MSRVFKKILIVFILFMFIMAFSTSYTILNLDNLAVVVAIGIDTSENNKLKVSFQFTNASSVSESGTTEKAPSILNSIDASSISSAINIMNAYIGKEVTLSHCKVIVFSEEIAKQGISDEIYTLTNDVQIRPSTNIVVSKCDASYYIDNSKPIFEPLITKYYEVFPNSSKYTGYTANATIGDFFNALVSRNAEPYAILGGINTENSQTDTTLDTQKDSSIKANESPLNGELSSENTGLAVFKDAKLVGELNAIETLSFLTLKNDIEGFNVSFPNPDVQNSYVDVYLVPSTNSSINVDFVNGSPFIKVNCKFNGKISSLSENSQYLNTDFLDSLSVSCNSYLESVFSNYLYKTSNDLKADINGFGRNSLSLFLTTKECSDYNWKENYKDAFFDVCVDCNIGSSGLLTET